MNYALFKTTNLNIPILTAQNSCRILGCLTQVVQYQPMVIPYGRSMYCNSLFRFRSSWLWELGNGTLPKLAKWVYWPILIPIKGLGRQFSLKVVICTTKWILQRTGHSEKVPIDSTLGSKTALQSSYPLWIIVPVWSSLDDYSSLETYLGWLKSNLIIEKVPEPYTRLLKHLKGTDYLGLMGAIYTNS